MNTDLSVRSLLGDDVVSDAALSELHAEGTFDRAIDICAHTGPMSLPPWSAKVQIGASCACGDSSLCERWSNPLGSNRSLLFEGKYHDVVRTGSCCGQGTLGHVE